MSLEDKDRQRLHPDLYVPRDTYKVGDYVRLTRLALSPKGCSPIKGNGVVVEVLFREEENDLLLIKFQPPGNHAYDAHWVEIAPEYRNVVGQELMKQVNL
jgi:hypothetical protein